MGRMEAKALVDGKLACQATLTCQIVPKVRETAPSAADLQPPVAASAPEAVTGE
jgi:hypothetical protein